MNWILILGMVAGGFAATTFYLLWVGRHDK